MSERPRAFDSNYPMMWSLIDGVTTEQVREEIPRLEEKLRKYNAGLTDLNNHRNNTVSKLGVLNEILARHEAKKLREEFKLTEDHKKIIKAIDWEVKSPYEYIHTIDICRLLDYKKPNDDYSDEQYDQAHKLLKEIPIAVNRFFRGDEV